DQRQGWALWAAMAVLCIAGVVTLYWAEAHDNPALHGLAQLQQGCGNLEGKETRFGLSASALFATVTTDASCGAVNSMHDSFTPLGGLVPLLNIQLGEVIFGGVGAGMYGLLIFVVLTVFIAGLMVGRTPEYLGKKIEAREMKLAMLYVLVFPLLILGFTGWAAVSPRGLSSLGNAGPHGLSELLYAFSSAVARAGGGALRRPGGEGLLMTRKFSTFDAGILRAAALESFRKLAPRTVMKNPVLFVVEIGSVLVTAIWLRDLAASAAGTAPR